MYQVSESYIQALESPAKVRRITGTIGGTSFTEENIISGSLIIDNQCSEGTEVKIGSTYIGQLCCVFKGINLNGQWYNKKITISEGLLLPDGETWEDVPLGIYYVVEANHAEDGVHVTAYDNMQRFDKKISLSTTVGTPYDFLVMITNACGVQMAQTENEIRALPNGTGAFTLYAENNLETFRDMLFWVAQLMGCFATIDRQGKLVIRKYGNVSVDTIGNAERWRGSTFSDFETYYTGISVTLVDEGRTVYYGAEIDDGLTYNLGENPFLQDLSMDLVLGNILSAMEAIYYTPFTVERCGCPAYDLGDQITFTGGIGTGKVGCIMSYSYTYHGAYRIEGYGSNPALANARSKTDKEISGLMKNSVVADKIQFYTYTNAAPYTVQSDYKEIIKIRFGANKDTIATFHAEIKLDAESLSQGVDKVIGNIKYIFNNVELDYKPAETWIEGDHLLHLLYYFPVESASLNTLSVRMNTDGEVTIGRANIQASISGQGLVATSAWDGYIEVEETFHPITFATTPSEVDAFGQEIDTDVITPHKPTPTDEIGVIRFSTTPKAIKFVDGMSVNKHPVRGMKWINVKQTTVGGETTPHKWERYKDYYTW